MKLAIGSLPGMAALAMLGPPPALGQTPDGENTTTVEEIVVTATRARQREEIAQKLEKDTVFDSLSQDEIAGVPDFNVADALRRIAGVATEFDEDEGRFVNVRGIDANLNYVTFDGIGVPSTGSFGGGGRNVNIEFFPSTAVKRLDVYKTFTPDIDGSSIGGYIDVVTRSAFDQETTFWVSELTFSDYSADDVASNSDKEELPFRIETTFTSQFGAANQFGVAVTGLYSERPREQDRLFTVGGIEDSFANVTPPTRFDSSLTSNNQERYGGQGKFEFRSGESYASVGAYFYRQQENETRFRNNLRFGAGDITETGVDQAVVANARMELNFDSFPIRTQGTGVQGHFDTALAGGNLSLDAGWAEQNFDHDTPALVFRTGFVPELGVSIDAAGTVPGRSTYNSPEYFADPSNYALSFIRERDLNTDEEVFNLKADFGWNNARDDRGLGYKFGIAFRGLERIRDNEEFRFAAADFSALAATAALEPLLADDAFRSDYSPDNFLFYDPAAVRAFVSAQNIPRDVGRSTSADFSYEEDVTAAYGLLTFRTGRLNVVGGLRFEATEFRSGARGDAANDVDGDFDNLLPSVNLSYELADGVFLRGAFSQTLGRPNPSDLTVTFSEVLPGDSDSGLLEIRRGNPDLEPRESDNFDLSLEYYFAGGDGLLSAALFRKDIDGDIFLTTEETTVNGQPALVTQNTNASDSQVQGLELQAYLGSMPFLPASLAPLGLSVNMTFLDGETSFLDGTTLDRRIRQADFLANASLFYNTGLVEVRVAYNLTDDFLIRSNRTDDRFEQIDASLRYYQGNHWVFKLEGRNLTNERRRQLTGSNLDLLFGETIIGRQLHFGVTYRH
ncbi:MAG: TonB-dependent receptor [Pseudomonadota bacterium]